MKAIENHTSLLCSYNTVRVYVQLVIHQPSPTNLNRGSKCISYTVLYSDHGLPAFTWKCDHILKCKLKADTISDLRNLQIYIYYQRIFMNLHTPANHRCQNMVLPCINGDEGGRFPYVKKEKRKEKTPHEHNS